jgi:hypothetical protein
MKLAENTAAVIAETARLSLTDIGRPELIRLIDAITDAAKDAIKDGHIGPSSVAILRIGYDDLIKGGTADDFFHHIGLPLNCDWLSFEEHYRTRGRIDHDRHAYDLSTFPPIVQRITELTQQRQLIPDTEIAPDKPKIGFD